MFVSSACMEAHTHTYSHTLTVYVLSVCVCVCVCGAGCVAKPVAVELRCHVTALILHVLIGVMIVL